KSRLSVVESIGREWSAYKDPSAKGRRVWQLQLAVRVKHSRRFLSLSSNASSVEQEQVRNDQSNARDDCQHRVLHHKSPSKVFGNAASPTFFRSLRRENRITLGVDPVCSLGWDVTPNAVLLVIDRYLLVGRVGLEQRPSPSIS